MAIREWAPSKEMTNQSVDLLVNLLRECGLPDVFLGLGVLWFHVISGLVLVALLLFFPCDTPFYFLCLLLWNGVLVSNIYFHGCILSRLERSLFHLDTWFGPVSMMNSIGTVTKDIANLVIKFCFAVPVSLLVLFRLLRYRDTLGIAIPLVLGIFYITIAFEGSQQFLVEYSLDRLEKLPTILKNWDLPPT